jgi:pimeloyl-ACP methyl ester carboxylesterase
VYLNHHRQGTGHGEPLVLIPGIGSRWQIWAPVIDRLAAQREVVALDLPGFGGSPMPAPGTPPGPESLTSLVHGFLGEAGLERPHVAGNSLGGLVALELARRGQARSATAISPVGFGGRPAAVGARASLWLSLRAARLMAPRAETLLRPAAARGLALSPFFAHPARVPAAAAAADVRAFAAAPWFDETLPTVHAWHFRNPAGITVPVTIAWGDKDRLLPPRQARRAARLIPSARMVTLKDCGHAPTYDDPEQVARVLLEGSAAPHLTDAGSAFDPLLPPADWDR